MSVALQSSDPPAEAAAKVLIRLGLAALFVALPCTGIFWRGAIYVLLPIGAALILIGAMLDAPRQAAGGCATRSLSPVGGAALFLTFWACLSLLWTPFPEEAAGRFLKSADHHRPRGAGCGLSPAKDASLSIFTCCPRASPLRARRRSPSRFLARPGFWAASNSTKRCLNAR